MLQAVVTKLRSGVRSWRDSPRHPEGLVTDPLQDQTVSGSQETFVTVLSVGWTTFLLEVKKKSNIFRIPKIFYLQLAE